MKMFTIILVLSLLAIPAFASGGSDKDSMDDGQMEKEAAMTTDSMDKTDAMATMELIPPFEDFMSLESAAMKADSAPTVLFFYATWCPSCKGMAKELMAAPEKLDGINLLIVDYDKSDELQEKYGVTYQHTFVLIDSAGEALDTWNGGGVDDLLMKAKDM